MDDSKVDMHAMQEECDNILINASCQKLANEIFRLIRAGGDSYYLLITRKNYVLDKYTDEFTIHVTRKEL